MKPSSKPSSGSPLQTFRLLKKPTKTDRINEKRKKEIKDDWPKVRDERKRELAYVDGTWTCVYCRNRIWTWDECVIAHIQPKGRRPDLRLEKDNLFPSHAKCNITSDPNYSPHRHGHSK
jgi:hypothetical protein